jgi:cytochrome c553
MLQRLRLVIPATVLLCSLTFSASVTFAKAEYSKKEKKACTTCHDKAGSKELNDVGKCYGKNNHSLAACEPPKASDSKK